jgi:hypothetical protein
MGKIEQTVQIVADYKVSVTVHLYLDLVLYKWEELAGI